MGMFDNSVELERSILKSLLSDVYSCRMYVFRVKENYFSSEARRFVFSQIAKEFSLSQNLLPEVVLETCINTKYQNRDKIEFLGEKNLISNSIPSTNLESSVRSLRDIFVGRETLSCLESVSALLVEGKYLDAATEFRQKAFSIETTEDTKQVKEVFSDIKNRIGKIKDKRDNPEKYQGLKTGFKTFDVKTGGLFKGEMTLLAGVTGLGKSTILKQMEFGILTNNYGKSILHIANEEYEDQVNFKFDALLTGLDYLDFKFAEKDKMTDGMISNWEAILENIQKTHNGRLYTREVPAFSDVSVIRRVFYELKSQGIYIDAIFIDHLPNMKPIQKAYGENNEREKVAQEVKELARELNVPIVIPTQAATQVEEKQMKGKRANKLDVYGSKAQIHHSNTFFIITFLGRDNKTIDPNTGQLEKREYLKNALILLDVKKNRDGPCFTLKLRHEVRSGRMIEIDIDPEVQKRIDYEHAQALKTGDYSTTISLEEPEEVKKPLTEAEANGSFDLKALEAEVKNDAPPPEIKPESKLLRKSIFDKK